MTLSLRTRRDELPDARRPSLITFVQQVLLRAPEELRKQVIMTALRRCAPLREHNDPAQIQCEVLRVAYRLAHEVLEQRPAWYVDLRLERATRMVRSLASHSRLDDRFFHFSRLARALVVLRGFGFTQDECAFVVGLTPPDAAEALRELDAHPDYAGVIHVITALLNAGAAFPEAAIARMLAEDTSLLLARQPQLQGLFTALAQFLGTHHPADLHAETAPPTIMISYNTRDLVAAQRLRDALLRHGLGVWMDRAEPGIHTENVYTTLARILGTAQAFIVVRGPHGPGDMQRREMDVILDQEQRRRVRSVVVIPEDVVGEPPRLGEFWDPRPYIDLRGHDYEARIGYILTALGMPRRSP